METQKTARIEDLKNAYIELKNSRMVLAPKHISKILKVVAENENVYNLVAEKILGYDFSGEYKKLIDGTIAIEDILNAGAVIPFGFCLLNEIDNQEIELVAFIKQVFGRDSEECFGDFCGQIVGEFVDSVLNALGTEEEHPVADDPSESIESLFASGIDERVAYIVSVITEKLATIKKVKKDLKRDIDITCYSIDLCLSLGQFAGILGLLSGLKYMIATLKKFKAEIAEIDVILDSINNL